MAHSLSISGLHATQLRRHLLDQDGKEGAAIALCGLHCGTRCDRLVVQKVMVIPHERCDRREAHGMEWNTDLIIDVLQEAAAGRLSVVKFHSHPTGLPEFSSVDDTSDHLLLPAIADWVEHAVPHGSAVILGDGRMFGRVLLPDGAWEALESITVVGDDIERWTEANFRQTLAAELPSFMSRHAQAFGAATTRLLNQLRVAVVGCSGTGSIVIEQLARLGVGELVLVDDDIVKEVNLNRILNATIDDADARRPKVDMTKAAIERMGLGTIVDAHAVNLFDPDAVRAIAGCDVLMGCVDTGEARYLMNRLATFYVLPYIDVGVALEADDEGAITQVCGYVRYLQPGRSSLLSQQAISMDQVVAEGMRRQNRAAYEQQRGEGYIANVEETRPAVISVNAVLAGMAVNELLARIHRFRDESNDMFAIVSISISQGDMYHEREPSDACRVLGRHVGRGDVVPLLDVPELSEGADS